MNEQMRVESNNVDFALLTLVYYEITFVYNNITEDNFVLKEPNYLGVNMVINRENCKTFADFFEVQNNIVKMFTLFTSKYRYNIIINHPLNTVDPDVYSRVNAYLTTEILDFQHISFLSSYPYTDTSKYNIRFIKVFNRYICHLIYEYVDSYEKHKRARGDTLQPRLGIKRRTLQPQSSFASSFGTSANSNEPPMFNFI